MDSMRHAVHTVFKSAAEKVMPTRSESGFHKHGVLTPEEFVRSGDYLVGTCSTWTWETGNAGKAKDWLPKQKQYLITRKVPSNKRASEVEQYGEKAEASNMLEVGADDEGWVAPPMQTHREDAEEISCSNPAPDTYASAPAEEEDDIPDIDDLELKDHEIDEAAVTGPNASTGGGHDHIVSTRTYDLMITYDKYYQVPRFWLVGYDENRQPLKSGQILEDVSEEHARKTITVDPFPHSGVPAASIHPCKHASVMKKLGSMAEANGKPFQVDSYLVLFLKFIASVIPTIEYDYTMAAGW